LLFPGPQLLQLARPAQPFLVLRALGFLVLLAALLLALVEGVEIGEQRIGKLVAAGGRLRPRGWRRRLRGGLGLLVLALLGAARTLVGLHARARDFFARPVLGLFARLALFLDLLAQRLSLAPRLFLGLLADALGLLARLLLGLLADALGLLARLLLGFLADALGLLARLALSLLASPALFLEALAQLFLLVPRFLLGLLPRAQKRGFLLLRAPLGCRLGSHIDRRRFRWRRTSCW